jgi:NAD(P)H dehydrogenase (quinone)
MKAPKKKEFPLAKRETLTEYDAFLFGVPTRFGNMPAQIKVRFFFAFVYAPLFSSVCEQTFWDATGGLWKSGALNAKYAGVFVSTGGPGGGQEETIHSCLSTLTHHGIIFVPFGYATGFDSSLKEVHGGKVKIIRFIITTNKRYHLF